MKQDQSEVCDSCYCNLGVLRWKIPRICVDCTLVFCSECTIKVAGAVFTRRCKQCNHLFCGYFTRSELRQMRIKTLTTFLRRHHIDIRSCKEKEALVVLVTDHFTCRLRREESVFSQYGGSSRNVNSSIPQSSQPRSPSPAADYVFVQQSRSAPDQSSGMSARADVELPAQPQQAEPTIRSHSINQPQPSPQVQPPRPTSRPPPPPYSEHSTEPQSELGSSSTPPKQRKFEDMVAVTVAELDTEDDIQLLTVRQLKQLLTRQHVNYADCREKDELRDKVLILYNDMVRNRDREITDAEACKICMDKPTDCVLLNCGHMVTCIDCGKRLADCPICRSFVVRCVKVFRS